jgi:hypothetical protein
MKTRAPLPGPLPEGVIPWVARFAANCRCGKRIRQGQSCLYDKARRKLMCRACAKLEARGLVPPKPPGPAEEIMDRVKQIYVMQKPLGATIAEELHGLIEKLRLEHAKEYSARRLIVEILRLPVDEDQVCIAMKFSERCHKCADIQPEGTAAVWSKSSHRIWCIECYQTM